VSAEGPPETILSWRSEEARAAIREVATVEEVDRLMPMAVAAAARLTAADYAALALLRPDHAGYAGYFHTGPGGEVVELPAEAVAGLPILETLRLTDTPIRVDDLRLQPATAGFPPAEVPAVVLLSLPLRAGRVLGHLLVARNRPEPFSPGEIVLAAELADATAATVRRLRADEQIATLHSRAQRLVRTNLALMRQLRPDGVLQWAVNDVRAVLDAEAAAILIPAPPDTGGTGAFVQSGLAPGQRAAAPAIWPRVSGLVADAIEGRRPVRLAQLNCDPAEAGFPQGHARVTSFLSAPLIRQRKVVGLLYAANKRRAPEFSEDDERFVTRLAAELTRSRLLTPPGAQPPELVDRIAAASNALHREMEATRTFLASLSHELRGSISGIMMSAELLTDPELGIVDDPDRVRTVGDRIHTVAGNLLELVDNLLDLGRLEAGRLDVRLQPVDLSAVLGDVDQVIAPAASAAGVSLEWPRLAGIPRLVADPIRLRQVLVNLLTNSVKFTPTGGRVWLEAEVAANRVTLAVCDTGKGIAATETERIFQPFERAAGSAGPGVGLGLAICRRIVELHGSSLEVASRPGEGSRFSFALRRSREPLAPRLLRPPPNGGAIADSEADPPSILVVEDDPVNRQSISDVLIAAGYRVRSVATRSGALEAIATSPADAVVLDVQLPDGNGLDIIGSLRGGVDRPLAVVVLSADRIGDTAERAAAAGCDRFGLKPIAARDLLELIAGAVAECRAGRPARPVR